MSGDAYREAPPPRPTCSACGSEFEKPPVYTPAGDLVCDVCEARRVTAEADQCIAAHPPPNRQAPVAYPPAYYGTKRPMSGFQTVILVLAFGAALAVAVLGIFGLAIIYEVLKALLSGGYVD